MVDEAVAGANAQGMYAILDLHWSDVGGQAPWRRSLLQERPAADAGRRLARVLGGGGGPLQGQPRRRLRPVQQPYVYHKPFTYNGPDEASWGCWRDGGCTVYASEQTSPKDLSGNPVPAPYTAVEMQQLYDVVRKNAPDSVVLAAGLDWASDLSGIGKGYGLRGSNVIYDIHVYTQWHNTAADWDKSFGYLTKTHPVARRSSAP